jgi:hypothetical protein
VNSVSTTGPSYRNGARDLLRPPRSVLAPKRLRRRIVQSVQAIFSAFKNLSEGFSRSKRTRTVVFLTNGRYRRTSESAFPVSLRAERRRHTCHASRTSSAHRWSHALCPQCSCRPLGRLRSTSTSRLRSSMVRPPRFLLRGGRSIPGTNPVTMLPVAEGHHVLIRRRLAPLHPGPATLGAHLATHLRRIKLNKRRFPAGVCVRDHISKSEGDLVW